MSGQEDYKNDPAYKGLSEYRQGVVDRAVKSIRETPGITMESLVNEHSGCLKLVGLKTLKKFALG